MIICTVRGILAPIPSTGGGGAMCGAIKCGNDECSLKLGECVYQKERADPKTDCAPAHYEKCPHCGKSCEIIDYAPGLIYCKNCEKYSEF